ncbi:FAD binding domain-containing protein [Proteocatella sphenisci]|uniref:FAD binding domain-containing protein n=1 Tax=Proteocatella sphenisci TaxID=181070 RepID=UPI00048AC5A3|nr:FAD binding domain-containing protein [Proteocatella sphenisci]
MYTAKNYIRVDSLEQAYELNKTRTNVVMGGLMWLKQSKKNINTLIDLSGLELNNITDLESHIEIGAMVTLRQMEKSPVLQKYFGDYFEKAFKSIVGVQFRNGATVGGSVFGRYGFSDVITALMPLETSIEVFNGSIENIPIEKFVSLKRDQSILSKIIIKKTESISSYESLRIISTDFPQLSVSASLEKPKPDTNLSKLSIAVGARPGIARLIVSDNFDISELFTSYAQDVNNNSCASINELIEKYLLDDLNNLNYGSNLKASAQYRQILSKALSAKVLRDLAAKGASSWK